jgi:hypothetical protein
MRSNLVYMAARGGAHAISNFLWAGRNYDVMYNDFSCSWAHPSGVEYPMSLDTWTFKLFAEPGVFDIATGYKNIALLSDDIEISGEDINRLFDLGDLLGLEIWQPAFTPTSEVSWPHLCQKPRSLVRETNELELSCPFYSREAYKKVVDTFDITYSAWAIEAEWANRCKCVVVDAIPAGHYRPMCSSGRKMPSGLVPEQEADIVRAKYGIPRNREVY